MKIKTRKYSIRVNDKVTSITVKNNIASLYIALSAENKEALRYPENIISNFISKCVDTWENENSHINDNKGLSDYVVTSMIKSLLDDEDLVIYDRVFANINGN